MISEDQNFDQQLLLKQNICAQVVFVTDEKMQNIIF